MRFIVWFWSFEVILYCISSAYHGHILHLVDRLLEFQVSWILDSLELYPGYPAILLRGLKEANSSEFYCFICLFAPCSIVRIMLNPERSTGFLSCSLRDYTFNLIFSYKWFAVNGQESRLTVVEHDVLRNSFLSALPKRLCLIIAWLAWSPVWARSQVSLLGSIPHLAGRQRRMWAVRRLAPQY